MPVRDNVEVHIKVNGEPLREYLVPEGEPAEDNEDIRYIQVTAGEHFWIMMRYLPGYQIEHAAHLASDLSLDGELFTFPPIKCINLYTAGGILLLSQEVKYGKVNINITRSLAKAYYLTFGAVELAETVANKINYDQARLDQMGEIRVTVFRGGEGVTNAEPSISKGVEVYEQVPAKRMKGRLPKNNVRYDDPVEQVPIPLTVCQPLPGKAGRKTVFVFRYRSRKTLQQLGCIRRSPSPGPDHTLMLERQEEMIREEKEKRRKATLENLELRQRITQLEESRGTKRERDEGGNDSDIEEMELPQKKQAVVVDLTEDDE